MSVRDSLVSQAASCRSIGSPLYATLLDGLIADYDRNGVSAQLLDGVTAQPHHDALPLRYLACGHRLALAGEAPGLARHLPSCGGTWDGSSALVDDFLLCAADATDEFRLGVHRNVQTNEVGRAAVLASGFGLISARHGLPIDQLEIGSSAGLLSRWDKFFYDTGESSIGDPAAPLVFGSAWWASPPPMLDSRTTVGRRRASDIAPIDTSTATGRTTVTSFVWPDQSERLGRLAAALDIADRNPVAVERADAGEWLSEQLAGGPVIGATTVVFHSIVWQYLPRSTRDRVRSAIDVAGASASPESPLIWMRMEPATATHADLRLTTYPIGISEVVAEVGYHGAGIRWLAGA